MTKALLALTAAMLIPSACVPVPPSGEAPAPTSAPGTPPPGAVSWHDYAGPEGTRRYRLSVPAGVDAANPAALLVMLHGCTQHPDDFAAGTRMDALAGERGAIVAWPEQPVTAHPQKCWSWYDPAHQARGAGEPAIVAGIAVAVAGRHPVDAGRVYLAGISAGGAMAVNVAAAYPERFAAVAVHSGVPYAAAGSVPEALSAMRGGDADEAALARALHRAAGAATPPPLLAIHGAADAVVHPQNGHRLVRQWAGERSLFSGITRHEEGGRTYTRHAFYEERGPATAELILVEGLGHAWSGGSTAGSYTDPAGPDASAAVLDFLLRHRRTP